jgi:hypothetical protein
MKLKPYGNASASSSVHDTDRYDSIIKLSDFIFNILPVFNADGKFIRVYIRAFSYVRLYT